MEQSLAQHHTPTKRDLPIRKTSLLNLSKAGSSSNSPRLPQSSTVSSTVQGKTALASTDEGEKLTPCPSLNSHDNADLLEQNSLKSTGHHLSGGQSYTLVVELKNTAGKRSPSPPSRLPSSARTATAVQAKQQPLISPAPSPIRTMARRTSSSSPRVSSNEKTKESAKRGGTTNTNATDRCGIPPDLRGSRVYSIATSSPPKDKAISSAPRRGSGQKGEGGGVGAFVKGGASNSGGRSTNRGRGSSPNAASASLGHLGIGVAAGERTRAAEGTAVGKGETEFTRMKAHVKSNELKGMREGREEEAKVKGPMGGASSTESNTVKQLTAYAQYLENLVAEREQELQAVRAASVEKESGGGVSGIVVGVGLGEASKVGMGQGMAGRGPCLSSSSSSSSLSTSNVERDLDYLDSAASGTPADRIVGVGVGVGREEGEPKTLSVSDAARGAGEVVQQTQRLVRSLQQEEGQTEDGHAQRIDAPRSSRGNSNLIISTSTLGMVTGVIPPTTARGDEASSSHPSSSVSSSSPYSYLPYPTVPPSSLSSLPPNHIGTVPLFYSSSLPQSQSYSSAPPSSSSAAMANNKNNSTKIRITGLRYAANDIGGGNTSSSINARSGLDVEGSIKKSGNAGSHSQEEEEKGATHEGLLSTAGEAPTQLENAAASPPRSYRIRGTPRELVAQSDGVSILSLQTAAVAGPPPPWSSGMSSSTRVDTNTNADARAATTTKRRDLGKPPPSPRRIDTLTSGSSTADNNTHYYTYSTMYNASNAADGSFSLRNEQRVKWSAPTGVVMATRIADNKVLLPNEEEGSGGIFWSADNNNENSYRYYRDGHGGPPPPPPPQYTYRNVDSTSDSNSRGQYMEDTDVDEDDEEEESPVLTPALPYNASPFRPVRRSEKEAPVTQSSSTGAPTRTEETEAMSQGAGVVPSSTSNNGKLMMTEQRRADSGDLYVKACDKPHPSHLHHFHQSYCLHYPHPHPYPYPYPLSLLPYPYLYHHHQHYPYSYPNDTNTYPPLPPPPPRHSCLHCGEQHDERTSSYHNKLFTHFGQGQLQVAPAGVGAGAGAGREGVGAVGAMPLSLLPSGQKPYEHSEEPLQYSHHHPISHHLQHEGGGLNPQDGQKQEGNAGEEDSPSYYSGDGRVEASVDKQKRNTYLALSPKDEQKGAEPPTLKGMYRQYQDGFEARAEVHAATVAVHDDEGRQGLFNASSHSSTRMSTLFEEDVSLLRRKLDFSSSNSSGASGSGQAEHARKGQRVPEKQGHRGMGTRDGSGVVSSHDDCSGNHIHENTAAVRAVPADDGGQQGDSWQGSPPPPTTTQTYSTDNENRVQDNYDGSLSPLSATMGGGGVAEEEEDHQYYDDDDYDAEMGDGRVHRDSTVLELEAAASHEDSSAYCPPNALKGGHTATIVNNNNNAKYVDVGVCVRDTSSTSSQAAAEEEDYSEKNRDGDGRALLAEERLHTFEEDGGRRDASPPASNTGNDHRRRSPSNTTDGGGESRSLSPSLSPSSTFSPLFRTQRHHEPPNINSNSPLKFFSTLSQPYSSPEENTSATGNHVDHHEHNPHSYAQQYSHGYHLSPPHKSPRRTEAQHYAAQHSEKETEERDHGGEGGESPPLSSPHRDDDEAAAGRRDGSSNSYSFYPSSPPQRFSSPRLAGSEDDDEAIRREDGAYSSGGDAHPFFSCVSDEGDTAMSPPLPPQQDDISSHNQCDVERVSATAIRNTHREGEEGLEGGSPDPTADHGGWDRHHHMHHRRGHPNSAPRSYHPQYGEEEEEEKHHAEQESSHTPLTQTLRPKAARYTHKADDNTNDNPSSDDLLRFSSQKRLFVVEKAGHTRSDSEGSDEYDEDEASLSRHIAEMITSPTSYSHDSHPHERNRTTIEVDQEKASPLADRVVEHPKMLHREGQPSPPSPPLPYTRSSMSPLRPFLDIKPQILKIRMRNGVPVSVFVTEEGAGEGVREATGWKSGQIRQDEGFKHSPAVLPVKGKCARTQASRSSPSLSLSPSSSFNASAVRAATPLSSGFTSSVNNRDISGNNNNNSTTTQNANDTYHRGASSHPSMSFLSFLTNESERYSYDPNKRTVRENAFTVAAGGVVDQAVSAHQRGSSKASRSSLSMLLPPLPHYAGGRLGPLSYPPPPTSSSSSHTTSLPKMSRSTTREKPSTAATATAHLGSTVHVGGLLLLPPCRYRRSSSLPTTAPPTSTLLFQKCKQRSLSSGDAPRAGNVERRAYAATPRSSSSSVASRTSSPSVLAKSRAYLAVLRAEEEERRRRRILIGITLPSDVTQPPPPPNARSRFYHIDPQIRAATSTPATVRVRSTSNDKKTLSTASTTSTALRSIGNVNGGNNGNKRGATPTRYGIGHASSAEGGGFGVNQSLDVNGNANKMVGGTGRRFSGSVAIVEGKENILFASVVVGGAAKREEKTGEKDEHRRERTASAFSSARKGIASRFQSPVQGHGIPPPRWHH